MEWIFGSLAVLAYAIDKAVQTRKLKRSMRNT